VQRERLGFNKSHPEIKADILEPDLRDLKRMERFFGHAHNVTMPCVRRERTFTDLKYIRGTMDEEHLVFFKPVRIINPMVALLGLTKECLSQLESPYDTHVTSTFRCDMDIWTM
jgi:hypothetical protein